ncbi:MAG: hypothetical protein MPN21_14320 [Thermoanaerobaculia bacterium]|nr:hypothetical protein [Thermoanaerobaculia bacterium]
MMGSSNLYLSWARWALASATALGSLFVLLASFGGFGLRSDQGAGLSVVAICKWICLALAACLAVASARRLRTTSWRWLALGSCLFAIAQSVLVRHQLFLGVEVPFPSGADPAFIGGMLALAAGAATFLRELAVSGFPLQLRERLWRDLLAVFGAGSLLFWLMLRPLLPPEVWDTETVLSLLYPICDLFLLLPAVLLLEVTREFADGRARGIWSALLLTFLLFLVGDLLFALFLEGASPLMVAAMDLCFLWGYAGLALTSLRQLDLSR